MLALSCLVLAPSALALPGDNRRDVLSLLGGDSAIPNTSLSPTHAVLHTVKPTTRSSASTSQSPKPSLETTSERQWTPTPAPHTDSKPTSVQVTFASTTVLSTSAESHPADHSSKTWQIIGITIIAVLFIATSIACAMFFDRLWRFLKDLICCTPSPVVLEELFPDCEKQNWDAMTSSGRNHRMPEFLHDAASVHTIRTRELPWNTDTKDWNTLHRHPSRRNNHPPTS